MTIEQDPHLEDLLHAQDHSPPLTGPLTIFNGIVARWCMYLAVVGLLVIVAIVFYQVIGRRFLHASPTWAESLALVLILYVTLLAAAVGVRDAGHIGMESLLVLAPHIWRERIEFVIHALVLCFGVAMAYNGWILGASVASYQIPNLPLPEVVRYIPLVVSGALIVLFSIEHMIALVRGREVVPTWH